MREYVRVGTQDQALSFREDWRRIGADFLRELGLEAAEAIANDAFFGRVAGLMARSQREQELKFELLVSLGPTAPEVACMSFNYHGDHIAGSHHLKLVDGRTAHSACVGFGMDRIILALFASHGLSLADWPASVRARLALT